MLRRSWIRVIYLLCVMLLILIVGIMVAYVAWRDSQVLVIGGAVAATLACALLAAVKKFRW